MLSLIQHLLHFIHDHPHWAIFISFLIAFIESIAIIGIFVPGSTILGLIGGLIGAGILDPTAIIIGATLGAILGDGLSYGLGYYFHAHIRGSWPFNRAPKLLAKGEAFFLKHGGKSLFVARFFGPLRGIIPLIGGMMRFSPLRFIVANVGSALVWAPGYIIVGILVGHQIALANPHHIVKIFAQIIIGFILFWIMYYLVRSQVIKGIQFLTQKVKGGHINMKVNFLKVFLQDIQMPEHHRQLSTALLGLGLLVLFLMLLDLILLQVQFTAINQPFYHSMQVLMAPFSMALMKGISFLGDKMILLPVSIVIFLALFFKDQKRIACHWLGLIAITILSAAIFKYLAHAPRPFMSAADFTDYSFPSGHVLLAVVFWGFLTFILTEKLSNTRLKSDIKTLFVFIVLIVSFARVFLGAHWLTDVIASLLLGAAYLNFTILSYRRG